MAELSSADTLLLNCPIADELKSELTDCCKADMRLELS